MRNLRSTLLIVAFYLAAVLLSALPVACLAVAYFLPARELPFFAPELILLGAFGLLIAWAVVPRKTTPHLNGIALNPKQQPRLDKFLKEVAAHTRQPLPSLVLITTEAHAATGFYSGFAGIGSQRVLSLGLPFFSILNRSELAALIAHELGHFHRGSLSFWAWILETQKAIHRLVEFLERHAPFALGFFNWLLGPFIRACLRVSRENELEADRFAAAHYGADTVKRVLEKNQRLEFDFHVYFQSDVVPALHAGYAPPLLEGFRHFLNQLEPGHAIRFHWAVPTDPPVPSQGPISLPPEEAKLLQSHPDLEDRLQAMDRAANLPPQEPSTRAQDLLAELPRLEKRLLDWEARQRGLPEPRRILWPETGNLVYQSQWDSLASEHRDLLSQFTLAQLPAAVDRAAELGLRMPRHRNPSPEESGLRLITAALCSTLAFHGWRLSYKAPGMSRSFRKGEHSVDPFEVIEQLVYKEIAFFEWEDRCAALGIADLPLAATLRADYQRIS